MPRYVVYTIGPIGPVYELKDDWVSGRVVVADSARNAAIAVWSGGIASGPEKVIVQKLGSEKHFELTTTDEQHLAPTVRSYTYSLSVEETK